MKKLIWAGVLILIVMLPAAVFNIEVETRQGINYKWHTIKIPLGLKVIDFFDRHYNYKALVRRLVGRSGGDRERAMKIFVWTHENVRKEPPGFPVIDDHVWNIIVRGYGASDQSSDVFVTLCNYAGLEAFYSIIYTNDKKSMIPLSLVRIGKEFTAFDPYNGVYFETTAGFASIADIRLGKCMIKRVSKEKISVERNFEEYLKNIPEIKGAGFNRANIQSPIRRGLYEVRKWLKIK